MDSSTSTLWAGPFPIQKVSGWFLLLPCFVGISEINATSVGPDQTPQNAASDLGLYCLPVSLLWDARHNKLIKGKYKEI